ncbi:MAG: glycoside hydrolase family 5 protein [Lachnospiraceae bacterium]|nr:glycoside hydrolase family 5 protein [Lachnospiraceae bacterium]
MSRRKTEALFCVLTAAAMLFSACGNQPQKEGASETPAATLTAAAEPLTPSPAEPSPAEFRSETASECVANMKIGWNLGNSLDCTGAWIGKSSPRNFETAWGNPVVTRELIHAVKESGFNAVRVPVTWLEKMDENGRVDEAWLARVREVVDYVLAEDMYCIVNVHHDTGGGDEAWLRADSEMYENGMSEKYVCLWEQIADYFKDYDQRLLFESMNEILDRNSNWGGSDQDSYDTVNRLNQLFVDTVRSSGGNNAERNIIVLTYGASSANSQVTGFAAPTDPEKEHLIAEVHIYDPSGFCGGTDTVWDSADEAVIDTIFERLNREIVTGQKLPMIIGEFGAQDHTETDEYTAERAKYAAYFVAAAKKYGITCFWWDDGGSMKIFDRLAAKPYCEPVIEALVLTAEGR